MSEQKRILALDLATKTGYAHTDGTSGVFILPPKESGVGYRFRVFSSWLADFMANHETDAIAYEKAHHRGQAATALAIGLITITELVASDERITSVKGYHTGTLKRHATGNGAAKKPEMAAAAAARNPTIKLIDDNHVDALWLLDLALNDGEL
jgi:Holliday junction resolvasome RuvABC endonuclease subunit